MATNLRLRPDAEAAVRDRAARTGQSQQELIRAAVDRYLDLKVPEAPQSEAEVMVARGEVLPPRTAYKPQDQRITPPPGTDTVDLLDRDERH